MSIQTFSAFYFGHTITSLNNAIDFKEGASPIELQATLNVGDYTLEEYVSEIKRALDVAGALTYSVSLNRTTRFITISSTSTFKLLAASGTRIGTGAWTMMGFAAVDGTGGSSYTGTLGSGGEYLPQHLLEKYVEPENFVEKTDAVVNESASGKVQVIQFGTTKYIQADIRYATNNAIRAYAQPQIEQNLNGVADLRTLMNYLITKAKFEFMPNRSVRTSFYKCILDKTPQSKNGTAYTLLEKDKIPGYYDTGVLVFRIVE